MAGGRRGERPPIGPGQWREEAGRSNACSPPYGSYKCSVSYKCSAGQSVEQPAREERCATRAERLSEDEPGKVVRRDAGRRESTEAPRALLVEHRVSEEPVRGCQ